MQKHILLPRICLQNNSLNLQLQLCAKLILILLAVAFLQSCASHANHASSMRDGLLQGKPHLSLAIAEAKDHDQEKVVSSLDKGMLRRVNGDFPASNQIFEVAKQKIERLHGISITENLAALTINETLREFKGDRYEQLLLHAYMAMNFIQLDQIGGARVEMLQADVKMMEWGDEPEEHAFLRYLEGIIFESLGEMDSALISYRKAYLAYEDKAGNPYPLPSSAIKKDLLRLLARQGFWDEYKVYKKEFNMMDFKPVKASESYGELVIILNNGLAPIKSEASVYIFSNEVQQNLRVAFPTYRQPTKSLSIPRIYVNQNNYPMETVENVDALARYALAQEMPGIMARAIARAVVKYNTQHSAQKSGDLAGLLMTITNLVTERADTRSWTTLPQEIKLTRILLPVGEHAVQIKMRNAVAQVVDVIDEKVAIQAGKTHFLIEHWVAPSAEISKLTAQANNSSK